MDFEIIGIGSALVDITVRVDESFLQAEDLPKGGMTLIDADRAQALLHRFSEGERQLFPGGATANVMAAFAHCGGRPAFVGKVGKDPMGDYFKRETERAGVTFIELRSEKIPTGTAFTFITPDGERTFATHLGAAVELSPADLPADLLCRAPILHIEAYLVVNRELIDYLLATGRANGQKVSMDLSSFGVVRDNLEYFERIAASHLNIVFANEDESLAFTGLSPRDSLDVFSRLCEIAVVKEGANGSYLARRNHKVYLPAQKVWVEETNGAGDAYAGAVLYGLSRGLSISTCGRLGTHAGALIVSQKGARATGEKAQILRDFAAEMDRLMIRRLEMRSLAPEMVAAAGRQVADFHAAAERCPEGSAVLETLRAGIAESLARMDAHGGTALSDGQRRAVREYVESFLEAYNEFFESRVREGRIIACHGDLHMEHIVLGDRITILDCMEFDRAYRYSDAAMDVAFLALDLEYHGRSDLAEVFVSAYAERSGDDLIRDLVPFYKVLRAVQRGNLVSLRLENALLSEGERKAAIATARRYFALAESYCTGPGIPMRRDAGQGRTLSKEEA